MVDSSQENSQAQASPPVQHTQDSYESQPHLTQDSQERGALCELFRDGADLSPEKLRIQTSPPALQGEACERPAAQSSLRPAAQPSLRPAAQPSLSRSAQFTQEAVGEALAGDSEEVRQTTRAPLSSVLESALTSSIGASPINRRTTTKRGVVRPRQQQPLTIQTSPASRRVRARGQLAAREAPTEVPEPSPERRQAQTERQPQARSGEEWEPIIAKRRQVVTSHKRRPDYKAFTASKTKEERSENEPMTPDFEGRISKRTWESTIQDWRVKIRDWYERNGGQAVDEIIDLEIEPMRPSTWSN
ncbi:unnamed protein product [Polarella glacialis]|uniref:Histone RNA hairpin-binding protein RNA-binding domain-containing protein n=1 Tax=Polarella glacialis TaxID=89957 RepID=A0A813KD57_POLGL|nr:unnamed protein product [Polarella glacialis]